MPNIYDIKQKAKRLAEEKGHALSAFATDPNDGTQATAYCVKCGATVTIGVYPVSTSGEAVTTECGGGK